VPSLVWQFTSAAAGNLLTPGTLEHAYVPRNRRRTRSPVLTQRQVCCRGRTRSQTSGPDWLLRTGPAITCSAASAPSGAGRARWRCGPGGAAGCSRPCGSRRARRRWAREPGRRAGPAAAGAPVRAHGRGACACVAAQARSGALPRRAATAPPCPARPRRPAGRARALAQAFPGAQPGRATRRALGRRRRRRPPRRRRRRGGRCGARRVHGRAGGPARRRRRGRARAARGRARAVRPRPGRAGSACWTGATLMHVHRVHG